MFPAKMPQRHAKARMKLNPAQFTAHLQQNQLAPIYLLTGDEPQQLTEATDALRAKARSLGFAERKVLWVDNSFSWSTLAREAGEMSLFASQRLIELRLGDKSPGTPGGEALIRHATNPPPDTLLLITAAKFPAATQKTKWFTALEKHGVVVTVNVPNARELTGWIQNRFKERGLHAEPEAITLLAERAEGHVPAAAQEIEKLRLLFPEGPIQASHILDNVADSARFEIFGWIDTILEGNPARIVRQLRGLREEAMEPFPIVSLLSREMESLCRMAEELQQGQSAQSLAGKYRFWGARKSLAAQAVRRHSPQRWLALVQQTVLLDKLCKGAAQGNAWDELQRFALLVGGTALATRRRRPGGGAAVSLPD